MGYITAARKNTETAEIFYKDWGTGQPVVFSHGWPLGADAWDDQLLFVAANGYRVIAHDRRGHGRSSQTWIGNDMDNYADDLAALIEALDLKDAILVGHSTGGGEATRSIGRHGTSRVAKAVLVGAVPPLMLKTPANPGGMPIEAFDQMRAGVAGDRSQFYKDLSAPFYGANRPGSRVSQGVRDAFWLWSMQVGLKGAKEQFNSDLLAFLQSEPSVLEEEEMLSPVECQFYDDCRRGNSASAFSRSIIDCAC